MATLPTSLDLARLCADIAHEKKATDIAILDVSKIVVISSYFVLASGDSRKQLQAIVDAIQERVRGSGWRRRGLEGFDEGKWILSDYGAVVVHLFDRESRRFYDLESNWADAPRVAYTPPPVPAPASPAPAANYL